jgi:hypothetical protein
MLPDDVAAPGFAARVRALLPPLRMPGAFADAATEQRWVAKTAEQYSYYDACVFAFCGIIHLVEMCRLTLPETDSQLGAQLFCVRAPPPAFCRHARFPVL